MVEVVVPESATMSPDWLGDDSQVLGAWREPLSGGLALLRVLTPGTATEAVVRELETRFRHEECFRLVSLEVTATLPRPAPKSELDTNVDDPDAPEPPKVDPQRVVVEELVQNLAGGATVDRVFLLTVVLSTIVAAVGLIRDNVAVIVGAMVIAPLLTPNMTLALATTLGDIKLARRALRVSAVGMGLAVGLAFCFGLVLPVDISSHEIVSRTSVTLSDIVLALAAGSAGALACTTGLSSALVGVMVAVALLPPLVTTGLLLGAGHPTLASEALLLTAVNIISVNIAGVGTFIWQNVRPRLWWEAERARKMVRVASVVWLLLLGSLALLICLASR